MNKPIHPAVAEHVIEENERLRGLLRDTASVAITMLYDSHKADVLAEFKVPELEAVVDASKHLQSHRVEHVYRRAWDAALSQQAEPAVAQDEREAFEAWLPRPWSSDTRFDEEGELVYAEDWVQGAWIGWQAARATRPAQTEQQPDQSGWISVEGCEP